MKSGAQELRQSSDGAAKARQGKSGRSVYSGSRPKMPKVPLIQGVLLCFPVVLLSMLEIGSLSGVFSIRFALALVKRPGAWLLFLLESSLVVAIAIVVAAILVQISLWMVLLAAPVLLGATFVYFRLLGRLAWWIAEVG